MTDIFHALVGDGDQVVHVLVRSVDDRDTICSQSSPCRIGNSFYLTSCNGYTVPLYFIFSNSSIQANSLNSALSALPFPNYSNSPSPTTSTVTARLALICASLFTDALVSRSGIKWTVLTHIHQVRYSAKQSEQHDFCVTNRRCLELLLSYSSLMNMIAALPFSDS